MSRKPTRTAKKKVTAEDRLPGDLTAAELIDRMIRVDQAGEYGARCIYEGQLAVLREGPAKAQVRQMAEQEARHLGLFDDLMVARRVRPTLLSPLWHLAGYALGAGTAFLGDKAAMACTVAVEEVIDEHYTAQSNALGDDEAPLRQVIDQARAQEIEHRDTALAAGATEAPGYAVLAAAIKRGSRLAIWLSERF